MRSTAALFLVLALSAPASAAAQKNPFNVDVSFGWQGCIRPLEWTPVEIGIQANLDEHFDGVLTVSNLQDSQAAVTITHRFVLTRGEPYYRPVVVKFAFGAPECRVAISDPRGRERWRNEYALWDFSKGRQGMTVVGAADLLVGFAGRNTFGLAQLPKGARSRGFTASRGRSQPVEANADADNRAQGRVYVGEKLIRYLPWDWTAYSSLDVLVLYDPDWSALRAEQSKAIAEWVSGGGKLLMVLGSHPLPPQHPLARLAPYRVGPARPLKLAPEVLSRWGCSGTTGDTVTCWSLEGDGAPLWKVAADASGRRMSAGGPSGFGRIGVVAFDPAVLEGKQQENLAPFWVGGMDPLLDRRTIEAGSAGGQEDRFSMSYEMDESNQGNLAVMNFLMDIPQMEPISIWWVIGLLTALALAIGPVDYFVLKRLDRLPLTWLTFAGYIGLFTVAAYYGVQALRSGPAQVRAVTVADGVRGGPAWSCAYSGIYAPASDAYRLDGLGKGQWWSAASPSTGYGYMNAFENRSAFSRQFVCIQEDGSNIPVDLPINIWSMQCMMIEGPAGRMPIDATITVEGDRVKGRVENRSDLPMARGQVRIAKSLVVEFGPLGPGQGADIDAKAVPGVPWERPETADSSYGYRSSRSGAGLGGAYYAAGSLKRTRSIEAVLKQGGAVVCAEYDEAPVGYKLAGRGHQVQHVQLVRLLVMPEGR
jgi:hypothetical protein